MIRTIITPANTDLHLAIPEEYVGKKVEVRLFSLEETEEERSSKKSTMAIYKRILSSETAEKMQKYVNQSRREWERDI